MSKTCPVDSLLSESLCHSETKMQNVVFLPLVIHTSFSFIVVHFDVMICKKGNAGKKKVNIVSSTFITK
jgi:hypothetical protein